MSKLTKLIPAQFVLLLILILTFNSYPIQAETVKTEIITNFEVFDADIRDVFRSLAELGGINILMDPQVKGDVSIKLKHGLSIKEAIELLSQTHGYSFRWITQTRTVIIGNERTFSNFESKKTKIYHLNYASPEQVKNALKIIITEDKIGIDPRTNQLTIKASILEHQNVEEIVARLDREMPQLNIEARMEELTKTASKELGINWEFDKVYPTNSFKLTTLATLKALEEQNEARLIANPNILITDNQEGKILIGDKFPVISTNRSSAGIEYIVSYIEVGTKLTVTPRINENNIVTVAIKAEVSNIVEWKKTGEGDDVPVIRTREASSVVRLHEGETFVLSGLHKEVGLVGTSGWPGLSKVPSKKRTKKNESNEQTEVVIFVTPKIIRSSEEMNNSKVHSVGEKPSSEIEVPKTEATPAPIAQVITPAVQEGDGKQKPTGIKEDGSKNTPQDSPTTSEINTEPKINSLQEEPIAKERPIEEKLSPDLTKLPKADGAPLETTPSVTEPSTTKTIDLVKVKIKAEKGETVTGLAKKYGIDKESILSANKINAESLTVGAEIILPIPKNHFYVIKPKETLWRIAKRYGTTVELLMEINNITDHTKVGKGQAIILPVPVEKVANNKF